MTSRDPKSAIKKAAQGARLVGIIFVLLGGLPVLISIAAPFMRGQIIDIVTGVVMIGPGVWYIIASVFLIRRQDWTVKVTYRVAFGQLIAVALAILAGFSIGRNGAMLIVPATLTIFFLPAVFALLFDVRKAGRELEAIEGHGFTVEISPTQSDSTPQPILRAEPLPPEDQESADG